MRQSEAIAWYSRPDVAAELVRVGRSREVAHMFRQGGYGRRPSIIQFPQDVKLLARSGVTSFHMSEERWKNPMSLNPETTEREIFELRKNWDLIIDIDCPIFEYSRLAAIEILKALEFHGVKNPSIKFSGNRGWHIGVMAEAFPSKIGSKEYKDLFPGAAVAIISYVSEFIKEDLKQSILEFEGDVKKIIERTGKKKEEIFSADKGLDVFALLDLDIAVGAVRHLIRMPLSLHEKSGLVSLPINPTQLNDFKREDASPKKIKDLKVKFFDSSLVKDGEAKHLLVQALDWQEKKPKTEERKVEYEEIEDRIPEKFFPPCINYILKGMHDGRKRGLFALMNFLRMMNWPIDEIEEKVREWNSTNSPPLKEGYIRSQISWTKRQRKKFPPPNCGIFYTNIGVPVGTCKDHKNPVSYAVRKLKAANRKG